MNWLFDTLLKEIFNDEGGQKKIEYLKKNRRVSIIILVSMIFCLTVMPTVIGNLITNWLTSKTAVNKNVLHVTPPISGYSQPTNPSSIDNKNTVHPAQEDSGSQAQPNTNTQQQNDNILDIDGTDIKEKPKKKKVYTTALPPKTMHDLKPDSVSPLKPAKPQPRTRPAPALAPKSNASEIILRKEAEDNYQ